MRASDLTAPGQVPLVAVDIGDDAAAWASLGFAVDGGACHVGHVRLRFTGRDGEGTRGIVGWTVLGSGPDRDVDGLPTSFGEDLAASAPSRGAGGATGTGGPDHRPVHPNGAVQIDHLVALTPDLDRTTAALAGIGLEPLRTREAGRDRLQRFFRMGEVILELVGPATPSGTGRARFWGLAFTVADLDATAAHMAGQLGSPKDAVQAGRRIATLRTSDEVSVPVAVMSARPRGNTAGPAPGLR